VERKGSPLEALRAKCQLAIDCGWDDIVIASEGSFCRIPQMYFAYADDEWVMFKDVKNNLEILGRHVSTHTNFNAKEVSDWKALQLFAEQVKFPSHALILRPAVDVYSEMQKGISTGKIRRGVSLTQRDFWKCVCRNRYESPFQSKVGWP
jgi:hypothetical protein